MKKLLLATLIAILFASCNNSKNVTIFEIGDDKYDVINTMVNEFTIQGEHWSKDRIIDKENIDTKDLQTWITLYECVYKGQEYYKVRVYFDLSNKVCRMELKIAQDKMKSLHRKLKAKYGDSRRANLPRGFGGWEIATVYLGDIDAVVVTEDNQDLIRTHSDSSTTEENKDTYELMVVSGDQYYELKRYL